MKNEQERKEQSESTQVDQQTDITRSQNRDAVADAAGHPARGGNAEGNAAGDQERTQAPGESGSHREGMYDKNEPKDKSTDLSQKR